MLLALFQSLFLGHWHGLSILYFQDSSTTSQLNWVSMHMSSLILLDWPVCLLLLEVKLPLPGGVLLDGDLSSSHKHSSFLVEMKRESILLLYVP